MMKSVLIRQAKLSDAAAILKIYEYYVLETAITYEYVVPSLEEFEGRMRHIMQKYPYLVLEEDGVIRGYAYAGAFHVRAAYNWSSEMTIYLDKDAKGCGYGRMLYEKLEELLKEMGITNLYACIGYPEEDDEYLTRNSANFHAHLGFTECGRFHNCGYKFNRWYHMIWMEKIIGEHVKEQEDVKWYLA